MIPLAFTVLNVEYISKLDGNCRAISAGLAYFAKRKALGRMPWKYAELAFIVSCAPVPLRPRCNNKAFSSPDHWAQLGLKELTYFVNG